MRHLMADAGVVMMSSRGLITLWFAVGSFS
jgi:hypothetical protein